MNNTLYDRMSKISRHIADSIVDIYRDGSVLELTKFQMREIMEKVSEPEKHMLLDHEKAAEANEN